MARRCDVLVIDDEQVVLDAVKRICSAEQYMVDTALDAQTGIQKLRKNGFRLVLCDLMLPDMDGLAFLNALIDFKLDIPVIIMTGYSTMQSAVKSLNGGAIDFIAKPFTADELCSTIYRGMRYLEMKSNSRDSNGDLIQYVPCPSGYMRLGCASWIFKEPSGIIRVGVTDFFLKTITSLSRVELLAVQENLVQGSYGALLRSESGQLHTLLSPVSGKIIERNEQVVDSSRIIEKDPYFDGWLYKVVPADFNYEVNNLQSCSTEIF
jgi:CheY-like chemotaxis protein